MPVRPFDFNQKLFLFMVLIISVSTRVNAQTCTLTGFIKGLGNQPVVFDYEQKGVYRSDTVFARNDRFVYNPKPSDNGQIHLRVSRPRYTSFWYEPGEITVSGSIEKPYKLLIEGTPENTIFSNYKQLIEWLYDEKKLGKPDSVTKPLAEQERKDILQFIRQHSSTRTSAYLLYWQTVVNGDFIDVYQKLLRGLSAPVQASSYGKQAAHRIQILKNQPVVGRKAPAFTLPDTAGRSVSLSMFSGKYVLLDFWGHWCAPCIRAFPKLKYIQEKYGNNLLLIGIAAEFEEEKPQWLKAVRTNKLNWTQLSELRADKGDVNDQYNITAFPTYFLLDKNGVVLERALNVEQIERKLIDVKKKVDKN